MDTNTEIPEQARRRFYAKTNAAKIGEIWLMDDIGSSMFSDGVTAKDVIAAIKQCQADGAKSLTVYVSSGGGDVFEAVAIYSAISRFPGAKTMCVDGLAASAASLILMAGDTILVSAPAMIMVHNPMASSRGNSSKMQSTAAMLDKIRDAMVDAYVSRTGNSADTIRSMMEAETWMTAAEAVKLGFADRVIASVGASKGAPAEMRIAASGVSPILASYQNLPPILRAKMLAQHPHLSDSKQYAADKRQPLASMTAANGTQPSPPHHLARPSASGETIKLPKENQMSKKDLNKAAKVDAFEALKSALEIKASALAENLVSVQASNDEWREKYAASLGIRAESEEICRMTGKATLAEARGVVSAWKQESEAHKELRAKVAKIEEDAKITAKKTLIEKGVSEGKIAPAEVEAFSGQDVSFIETILKVRAPIANMSSTEQPHGQKSVAGVPADVAEMAKQMGWDTAKIAEQMRSGQTPAIA